MGLWNETLSKRQTYTSLTSWVEVPTNHGQNSCQMQTSVKQNLVLTNLKKETKSRERQHKLRGTHGTRGNQRLGWACTNILSLISSMIQIPQPCVGNENDVLEKKNHTQFCLMPCMSLVSFLCLWWCYRPPQDCMSPAWKLPEPTPYNFSQKVCLPFSSTVTSQNLS